MKRNSFLLAVMIGLEMNKKIYNPLLKYKKDLCKRDYFTSIEYFVTFLDESILRFDIEDIEYFKFNTWRVSLFNDVYSAIVELYSKYYDLVGFSFFQALHRLFHDVKEIH